MNTEDPVKCKAAGFQAVWASSSTPAILVCVGAAVQQAKGLATVKCEE